MTGIDMEQHYNSRMQYSGAEQYHCTAMQLQLVADTAINHLQEVGVLKSSCDTLFVCKLFVD